MRYSMAIDIMIGNRVGCSKSSGGMVLKDGVFLYPTVITGDERRYRVEVWKDNKMLFPTYDESVPGRNLFPLTKIEAYGGNIEKINNQDGYPAFKCTPKTPDIGNNIGIRKSAGVMNKSGNGEHTISLWCKVVNYNAILRSYTDFYNSDTGTSQRIYSISKIIPTQEQNKWFKISAAHNITAFDRISAFYMYSDFANAEAELYTTAPKIEKGDNPDPVWTPTPEELLELAKITATNCSYEIDGDELVLYGFIDNNGTVNIEVSYGDDWVRSKSTTWTANFSSRSLEIFKYASSNGYALPTKQVAYDEYIRGLINSGLFDKLDLHYIFSGDGDINFKLINVVNPGTYNGTAFGGLEWSNEGVKGNGVNGYVDTNFNPFFGGEAYSHANASINAIISQAYSTNSRITGTRGNSTNSINNENTKSQYINSATPDSSSESIDFRGTGLKSINRISEMIIYGVNKSIITESTQNVNIVNFLSQRIFNSYHSSSPKYGDMKVSSFSMGASLTYEETQIFRELFNKYLKSNNLQEIA